MNKLKETDIKNKVENDKVKVSEVEKNTIKKDKTQSKEKKPKKQDKKKEDKVKQDKTKQDKTKQDKTKEEKAKQDKTKEDKKNKQEKTKEEKDDKETQLAVISKKEHKILKKLLKFLITIVLIFASFVGSFFIGVYITNKDELKKIIYKITTIEFDNYIKERNEIETKGLFELADGTTSPEVNLMKNDMTWNEKTNLYYKIIPNMEEYNKYKERINIPEMAEQDFEEKFLVIVANENERSEKEKDLIIYNVVADETTTHIVILQRAYPNINSTNNLFYAIVDKSQLRETVDISI